MRRLVMSVDIADGQARMEVSGSAGTGAELGLNDFLIATDTGGTIVDFSAHTYRKETFAIASTGDLVTALDRKQPTIITKVEFDTMKVATGDTIEGRPTHHYQLKLDYRGYQPDSLNELQSASTTMTADYWVADMPEHFNNPFIGFATPKPGYSPGLKVWIDRLQAAADAVNKGMTVKYEANGEDHIEWPRPNITKRTMEITGCVDKNLDPSIFSVPAGYTMTTGRGAGRGGGFGGE